MINKNCWQCGRDEFEILSEDDPDWVLCIKCRSRIMTDEEFRAEYDRGVEERAKRHSASTISNPSGTDQG